MPDGVLDDLFDVGGYDEEFGIFWDGERGEAESSDSTDNLTDALAERLKHIGDNTDWYLALFSAAMEESDDWHEALEMADQAYAEQKTSEVEEEESKSSDEKSFVPETKALDTEKTAPPAKRKAKPSVHAEATAEEGKRDGGKDTPEERAQEMAEILTALYGDHALDLLLGRESGEKSFPYEMKGGGWDESKHPRGSNGRFIEKNSSEAREAAVKAVKEAKGQPKTPENVAKVAEHLAILTVKQLRAVKKEMGIKGTHKVKAELVAAIADKLHTAEEGKKPETKPEEKLPEKEPEPEKKPEEPEEDVGELVGQVEDWLGAYERGELAGGEQEEKPEKEPEEKPIEGQREGESEQEYEKRVRAEMAGRFQEEDEEGMPDTRKLTGREREIADKWERVRKLKKEAKYKPKPEKADIPLPGDRQVTSVDKQKFNDCVESANSGINPRTGQPNHTRARKALDDACANLAKDKAPLSKLPEYVQQSLAKMDEPELEDEVYFAAQSIGLFQKVEKKPQEIPENINRNAPIADRIKEYRSGAEKVKKLQGLNKERAAKVQAKEKELQSAIDVAQKEEDNLWEERKAKVKNWHILGKKDQARMDEIRQRHRKAADEWNNYIHERGLQKFGGQGSEDIQRVAETLKAENPVKLPYEVTNVDGKFSPDAQAGIDKGINFLSSITDQGNSLRGPSWIEQPFKMHVLGKGFRAAYYDGSKTVKLGESDSPSAAVHELGHHLENTIHGAREAAQEFLKHRMGNEQPKKYIDMGMSYYGADEKGFVDQFEKAFPGSGHYVGKIYDDGDTEIISMGVQRLFEDAGDFAEKDPEYCQFILGILDGSLRK